MSEQTSGVTSDRMAIQMIGPRRVLEHPRGPGRLDGSRLDRFYGDTMSNEPRRRGARPVTWTKLSDDFDDECATLTDAAFRTHVQALLYSMRRETSGVLTQRDVTRFPDSPNWMQAVDELVDRGFWEACDNGYLVVHHMEHQPDHEVLAARRRADAERQRRKRRKAAGLDSSDTESRRDSGRDDPRDPGRGGTGRVGETPNQA